jgi:excisionase family DNA binding protein
MHTTEREVRMVAEAPERLLISVDDAARAIDVSRRKFYGLIDAGDIPVIRVGRSVKVPLEGLRHYVARLTSEQAP